MKLLIAKTNCNGNCLTIGRCSGNHNARIEGIISQTNEAFEINWRGCVEVTEDSNDVIQLRDIYYLEKDGERRPLVNGMVDNEAIIRQKVEDFLNNGPKGLKRNTRAKQRAVWNGQQPTPAAAPSVAPAPAAQPAPAVEQPAPVEVATEPTPAPEPEKPKVELVDMSSTISFLSKEELEQYENELAQTIDRFDDFFKDKNLCRSNGEPIFKLKDQRYFSVVENIIVNPEKKFLGIDKLYTIEDYIVGAGLLLTATNEFEKNFNNKIQNIAKAEWNALKERLYELVPVLAANKGFTTQCSSRLIVLLGDASVGKDHIVRKLFPDRVIIASSGSKETRDYTNPMDWDDEGHIKYVKGLIVKAADINGTGSHTVYLPEANLMQQVVIKEMLQPLCDNSKFYRYGDREEDIIEIHPDFKIIMSLNPTSINGDINPFEEPIVSRMSEIYYYTLNAKTLVQRAFSDEIEGVRTNISDDIRKKAIEMVNKNRMKAASEEGGQKDNFASSSSTGEILDE